MKPVRFAITFLAVTLFALAALLPPATQAVAAPSSLVSFADAFDPHLLAPISIASAPLLTISVEPAASTPDYACKLLSQKPKDWTKMQRRHIFDATWTVRNTGSKNWGKNGIDFKYISGTKMHTYGDAYDLANDVGSGQSITLIVDMISPKEKGYYTAVWGLFRGSKSFCKLSITINVNR
ncbi:MAG: NBR1-Ig-like domain-containing protein [Anaerolineales bacterium]|nr:NBR1-Ig-like domain-containing protein [Anaerolineales bacterium]MDW8277384.1 NBR1-Ig-like domain-containing protein [Anaerolineales bacterium]